MENGNSGSRVAVAMLAIILLVGALFLFGKYIKSEETTLYPKLEVPTVMGTEKYKILGPVMLPNEKKPGEFEPGFQVHLDDGRIRYIAVPQAARDQDLLNVSEGYLYRINGQFYLKKN